MNKEELDINQELEQMRQDYAALKDRYDKQQIITDYLLQKAMKSDIHRLFLSKKAAYWAAGLLLVFVVLFFVQGYELWLLFALVIFGLMAIIGVFWAYKGVREEDIYNGDILSTAGTLRKFKKRFLILEAGICIYFFAFVVVGTIYMTSMNISTGMMWRRGILIALICVGTLSLEFLSSKRLLNACDNIIERLQMKEDDAPRDGLQ